MQVASECSSFREGALFVRTPWDSEAKGIVLVNDEAVSASWSCQDPNEWRCRHGLWELTVRTKSPGAFSLRITNTSGEPRKLSRVVFARWAPSSFAPELNTSEFRELIHGGSFNSMASGVKCVGRKTPWLDFAPPSNMLTVYQREGGGALLLGVVPSMGEALSEFATLHSAPHMEGTFGFEVRHEFGCTVDPGGAVSTSPVIALSGSSGVGLMDEFGQVWQDLLPDGPVRPPAVGWNSWDYHSGAVTRQAMDDELAAGRELFGDALRVFAIDEGWERQWGTWEPNAKFGDLADFCRHVKSQGAIPGVWTSPLLVNTYSPLFMDKPHWFAARADGQLQTDAYAYGPMAYLDVTQPDVIDHIKGIFARLRETGFEYFKVDFCHCILKAAKFHDPRVGRNDLIRRAFTAIREAIGDDAYLLSCGSPYESVVGLVDAVRSTGDIHIYWGHVLRNAGALATRWWMQGRLWNCDPDFLVVRGPDTAAPPYGRRQVVTPLGPGGGWIAGREFNETEARAYALLVHLTAGDVVLGDALLALKPNAIAMLKRVMKPRSAPGIPVDLFESEQDLPRIWISRGEEDTVVGLFNWTEKTSRIDFDPTDHGLSGPALDFWTDEPITDTPRTMPRRSSIALRFGP